MEKNKLLYFAKLALNSLISRNDVKSGVKTTTSVTFPLFSTSYDTAENRLGDDTHIGRHILVLGI